MRVDSGVYMNYEIPPFYDSMISKLIVWGMDRQEAINRMKRALSEYIILGVKTTIPFHKAIMRNEAFRRGELHTHFVDEYRRGIEPRCERSLRRTRRWLNVSSQHSSHQRRLPPYPRR